MGIRFFGALREKLSHVGLILGSCWLKLGAEASWTPIPGCMRGFEAKMAQAFRLHFRANFGQAGAREAGVGAILGVTWVRNDGSRQFGLGYVARSGHSQK